MIDDVLRDGCYRNVFSQNLDILDSMSDVDHPDCTQAAIHHFMQSLEVDLSK